MTRARRSCVDLIIEQYVTLCECVLRGGVREFLGGTGVREPAALAWRADVAAVLAEPEAHGQVVLAWYEMRWRRCGLSDRIRQVRAELTRTERRVPSWVVKSRELEALEDQRRAVKEALGRLRQRGVFALAIGFVSSEIERRRIKPLWR